jgi:RNA polymerase sigma-70 factor (ECF subfamily)
MKRWEFIRVEALWRAVGRLERSHREVVVLRWSQGCSYQMISQQLGIPVSTVGTRLLRAHRKLRVVLDPPGSRLGVGD